MLGGIGKHKFMTAIEDVDVDDDVSLETRRKKCIFLADQAHERFIQSGIISDEAITKQALDDRQDNQSDTDTRIKSSSRILIGIEFKNM